MLQLTAATLKGNWATLLLPINQDNSIDFNLLSHEIDYLIAAGVDGIYSNGTAGEFHNQTEKEFDQINEVLSAKCLKTAMQFQIGASHPSPLISLQRVKRSVGLNPGAIQVILPDWVKPNAHEQITFLQGIAECGLPIVLYNPPHAKQVLRPKQFAVLKKAVPQLIGIKVLNGDHVWAEESKTYLNELSVFVPGHMLASGVNNGVAAGAYSNVACINPAAAQIWWQQMHTDIQGALDLEKRILTFFETCITPYQEQSYSNPALDKFLAAVGNWMPMSTRLRWPYQYIPLRDAEAVRKQAQHLIPEFFK